MQHHSRKMPQLKHKDIRNLSVALHFIFAKETFQIVHQYESTDCLNDYSRILTHFLTVMSMRWKEREDGTNILLLMT